MRKKRIIPYLFLFPQLSIFMVFFLLPIFFNFYISLTRWSPFSSPKFIGLSNYIRFFLHDDMFYVIMKNTVFFSLMVVPPVTFISLFIAIFLNKAKAKAFFRAAYFVPVISSMILAALIWKWIYHGEFGLLNYLLSVVGIPGRVWLGDTSLALPSVAVVSVWKIMGYYMIIFLAGLQSIPSQLYEAAKIDGASHWKNFLYITFPLLRPAILLVVVLSTIFSFQVFDTVYAMTRGGPANATATIVWYLYQKGFQSYRLGYAASIGGTLFLMIFVVALFELFFLRTKFEY